jgi:beta-glucosidase
MERRSRHAPALNRFLWGVATSAFQLEGAPACDWTSWKVKDEADRAARLRGVGHLERTEEDLGLLSRLGVNAYRFSVEWSRVAPRRREWNRKAMDRYVLIAARLREAGIEPVVTLHHFTNPEWIANGAAWAEGDAASEFLRFAEKAARALREHVRLWVTFNEPNVYVTGGYLGGLMPPGKKNLREGFTAYANILRAHASVYDLIHAGARERPEVGIAHSMVAFRPYAEKSSLDGFAAKVAHTFYNLGLIEAFRTGSLSLRLPFLYEEAFPVGTRDKLDFLGVNYYFRLFLRLSPASLRGPEYFWEDRKGRGLTETGWEVYPKGFEESIRTASAARVPVVITENGAAETCDRRKIAYMKDHLRVLHRLIREGVDIRGYFWWSLMDNYEWLEGLRPRFGLYRVDFESLDRVPTRSADFYARWIKRHPDPLKR